jgi:predicted lipoprotein with Yx(FWY)xxD motif
VQACAQPAREKPPYDTSDADDAGVQGDYPRFQRKDGEKEGDNETGENIAKIES